MPARKALQPRSPEEARNILAKNAQSSAHSLFKIKELRRKHSRFFQISTRTISLVTLADLFTMAVAEQYFSSDRLTARSIRARLSLRPRTV
jgi:hypothetical protein